MHVVQSARPDDLRCALGFDPAIVYVPHPIQNRTAAELAALADVAIVPALEKLVNA